MASKKQKKHCVTFQWRIENFTYWNEGLHGSRLQSPVLTDFDRRWWYLSLFPKGLTSESNHLSVCFNVMYSELSDPADLELSFIDGDGSPIVNGTLRNQVIKTDTQLNLPDCATQKEVFGIKKSSFLPHDTLTVRCSFWNSREDLRRTEHWFARTRLSARRISIMWPITEFGKLQLNQKVTVPEAINLNPCMRAMFTLNCFLTGASLKDASVNFEILPFRSVIEEPILMSCKISFIDGEQKATKLVEGTHKFIQSENKQTWKIPNIMSKQKLLQKCSDSLCNDVLTLLCEFIYGTKEDCYQWIDRTYCGTENRKMVYSRNAVSEVGIQTSSDNPGNSVTEESHHVAKLHEDFLTLYADQTLSDFELRSGDDTFPVHKNVLSARSPVFKTMFTGNMTENFLVVPDVDPHTLGRMLVFLYTSNMDHLQCEGAAKLYFAADKYKVQCLKQRCSSILRSSISVSNVSVILTLADTHQDTELLSFAQDFILEHFDDVMLSDEWRKFMERDAFLAGNTMRNLYTLKVERNENPII